MVISNEHRVSVSAGVCVALGLYADHAPAGISFRAFGLFMGIAMSIRVSVLARILDERRMLDTPVGSMALTCAAVGDVTAVDIARVRRGGRDRCRIVRDRGAHRQADAGVRARHDLRGVRRCVRAQGHRRQDAFSKERVALVIGVAFFSALVTEVIGIHALFGAFLAGAILPVDDAHRTGLRDQARQLQFSAPVAALLRVHRTAHADRADRRWTSVFIAAGIIVVATAGKLGGDAIARFMGMDWTSSLTLGR